MSGAVAWWEGLPGLDWRYLPDDIVFGDKVTAITCAVRIHGFTVMAARPPVPREVENTADRFFAWLREAADGWDGYIRRLSLAMACASAQGVRDTDIIRHAQWYRQYFTKPPDKRGGFI